MPPLVAGITLALAIAIASLLLAAATKERAEQGAKARAEQEAKAKAEQEAKIKAELALKAKAEAHAAQVKAEADAIAAAKRAAFAKLESDANAGIKEAQCKLAEFYLNGEGGVAINLKEALQWYRKAGDQGSSEAQLKVAQMYEEGWGVLMDKTEAFKWNLKAANQGNTRAQGLVSEAWGNGSGVRRNWVEAYKWALLEGEGNASYWLVFLTPAEASMGYRLAQNFKPSGPDAAAMVAARAQVAAARREAQARIEQKQASMYRSYADQEREKVNQFSTLLYSVNDSLKNGTLMEDSKNQMWRSDRIDNIRKMNPDKAQDPAALNKTLDELIKDMRTR